MKRRYCTGTPGVFLPVPGTGMSFYRYRRNDAKSSAFSLCACADDDAVEPLVATKRAGGVCHFL